MNRYEIALEKKPPPPSKKKKKKKIIVPEGGPHLEIIVGERSTGKTSVLISRIMRSPHPFVFCTATQDKHRVKRLLEKNNCGIGFVESWNNLDQRGGFRSISGSIVKYVYFDDPEPNRCARLIEELTYSHQFNGIVITFDRRDLWSCLGDWRNGFSKIDSQRVSYANCIWKLTDIESLPAEDRNVYDAPLPSPVRFRF